MPDVIAISYGGSMTKLIKQTFSIRTPLSSAEEGGWVMIFPAGTTKGRDNRGPYRLEDMEAVVAASLQDSIELFVDRDHVADIAAPGTPAPAAGWVKEMQAREDGIYARIQWTPPAREQLKNQEYRYLSPTFYHDKDGIVRRIERVSLVNDPNFEMRAIAARETQENPTTSENTMEQLVQELAALLGLEGESISEEAVKEAVAQLVAVKEAVKEEVDAPAEAETAEEIVEAVEAAVEAEVEKEVAKRLRKATAAKSGNPDPSKFVSIEVVEELKKTVASVQGQLQQRDVNEVVDGALKEGKILKSQLGWAKDYASRDLKGFQQYLEKTPAVFTPDNLGQFDPEQKQSGSLTPVEKSVASQLGLKEEQFKSAGKKA